MNMHVPKTQLDFAAASRFIELIAGPDASVWFRLIHDKDKSMPAILLFGTLSEHMQRIKTAQGEGYGAFMVINEGGNKDAEITNVRAVFIDADDTQLPASWHVPPDFIVQRDDSHWHAYWIANDFPVEEFKSMQKRLAEFYGTDKAICNASRVMRIPGLLHQKNEPTLMMLHDHTEGIDRISLGRGIDELLAGLPEVSVSSEKSAATKKGWSITRACLLEKLRYIDPYCDGNRIKWFSVGGAIHYADERGLVTLPDMITPDPSFDGLSVFDDWSAGELWPDGEPSNYEGPEDCEKEWNTLSAERTNGATLGTIDYLAREGGYEGATDRTQAEIYAHFVKFDPTFSNSPSSSSELPGVGYPHPKTGAELANGNFPRSEYVWQDFILHNHVNLIYGDGGTGKTLLAEHIAVAVASGRQLFGRPVKQMPVLLVLAEDGDGETKARLVEICAKLGVNLADLSIRTWCLPGYDATLAHIADDGTWKSCDFWEPLREQISELGDCFVVLDSLADIFALNENLRLPANTAIKKVLGSLCRDTAVTILALAHPSKAAMIDGTGYAGSTAWNNAVRNRLTFERPDPKGAKRVLKVAKYNYGKEPELELLLLGMNFIEFGSVEAADMEAQEREMVRSVVFDLLDKDVMIVRGNGSGQKPGDVAKAVLDKHKLKITPKRVLDHLNTLERMGVLAYHRSEKKRGSRAGFYRPGAC